MVLSPSNNVCILPVHHYDLRLLSVLLPVISPHPVCHFDMLDAKVGVRAVGKATNLK